eukprot:2136923-Amphidinium_carterae.1
MNYIKVTQPTAIIMAPVCTPFSAWSHLNRHRAEEAWRDSYSRAAPHGRFCAKVALHQLDSG